jgi:hypothetical protein
MTGGNGGGALSLVELAAMDVARLNGVGDRKLDALHKMGIRSLLDLLWHYPRRYLDRTGGSTVGDLRPGAEGLVLGRIGSVSSRKVGNRRSMVTAEVRDATGSVRCTFFNQPWRERQLQGFVERRTEVAIFGKVEEFVEHTGDGCAIARLDGEFAGRHLDPRRSEPCCGQVSAAKRCIIRNVAADVGELHGDAKVDSVGVGHRVTDTDDAAHHESDGPSHAIGVAEELVVALVSGGCEVALHALHQGKCGATQHRIGTTELCKELHRCIGSCCAVELCAERAERGGCFGRAGRLIHGVVNAAAEAVDDCAPAERLRRQKPRGEPEGLGAGGERRDCICEGCFAGL